jgi:hypothetical protein
VESDEIRALVKRLARPDRSGGAVIERAAILAEAGSESAAILAWIEEHGGKPEAAASATPRHGLHGARFNDSGGAEPRVPLRFVLPADALG